MTEEQRAAQREANRPAFEAAIRQFAERLEAQQCTVCGEPVETYEQVGRCVYGDPCGHRQYQGKVPASGRGKP